MTLWQSSGYKFSEFTTENSLRLVLWSATEMWHFFHRFDCDCFKAIEMAARDKKQKRRKKSRLFFTSYFLWSWINYVFTDWELFFAPLRSCKWNSRLQLDTTWSSLEMAIIVACAWGSANSSDLMRCFMTPHWTWTFELTLTHEKGFQPLKVYTLVAVIKMLSRN